MSFSAFIGFQGWNSWTPETSMFSGMSRSATASLLPGWFLASSFGGLISILVSRLELSSASRLRAAALSEAVLSEESCASARVASRANKTIANRMRTPLLYCVSAESKQNCLRPRETDTAWRRTRFPCVPAVPVFLCSPCGKDLGRNCGDRPLPKPKNQAAHKRDGLVWQCPPGRRGKLITLIRRRIRARRRRVAGRLRRCRSGPSIGHQADIHAAVLGTAVGSLIRLHRLVLTQPDQINLVGRNTLLRRQILNHSIGAALAQIVVVLFAAHRVGRALDCDDVSLGRGDAGGKLVDRFLGLLRQIVLVEPEMHRRLHHWAIVIEVDDRVGQSVHTLRRAVRRQLRLIGVASSGHSLLVYLCGARLHGLDSRLRALIDVLNVFRILRRQVVKFIGLVDQRRGLLTHVILG